MSTSILALVQGDGRRRHTLADLHRASQNGFCVTNIRQWSLHRAWRSLCVRNGRECAFIIEGSTFARFELDLSTCGLALTDYGALWLRRRLAIRHGFHRVQVLSNHVIVRRIPIAESEVTARRLIGDVWEAIARFSDARGAA